MKLKIWLISVVIINTFSSCDDGDLIVTSFDFEDQTLQICGGENALVFFKINNDAQESIALNIASTSDIFLQEEIEDIELSTTNFVTYRKYNGDIDASYFCSSVPPTSPQVNSEYLAESGTVAIDNTLILDDDDGVPEEEELGNNEDEPMDTDGDGIPDYYDADDDGDNVPTRLELFENETDEENGIYKDTDGDGIPDYLDDDDDGDGILTRNESTDGDIDPLNDINDESSGIPDFLNANVAIPGFEIEEYILHSVNRNASISIVLFNLVLVNADETIVQESLSLGAISDVLNDTIILAPEFQ
ncbi:hypothetical protein SCB49_12494 [unidentified eubacterium SCB49]|nr:hypothetical protein SCB49_12494 [unidentified eubacterium SCB49]